MRRANQARSSGDGYSASRWGDGSGALLYHDTRVAGTYVLSGDGFGHGQAVYRAWPFGVWETYDELWED